MKLTFSPTAVVLFLLCLSILLQTTQGFHVKETTAGGGESLSGSDLQAAFDLFKSSYAKVYATAREEAVRMRNFATNYKNMLEQRAGNPHAQFNVNYLFDRSEKEVFGYGTAVIEKELEQRKKEERMGTEKLEEILARREERRGKASRSARDTLREACKQTVSDVDWRACGAVSYVKDQGSCGSCWAFSAIGNIESQWYLNRIATSAAATGAPLLTLSEQHVVSCDDIDSACFGGLMENTYSWLLKNSNGYVYTEESYPYVSGSGEVPPCADSNRTLGAFITSHIMLQANENVIEEYLREHGPLAIAVDATSFLSYHGGILTDCSASRLNHGVLLVGYHNAKPQPGPDSDSDSVDAAPESADDNISYWIIKNSWGARWGEQGFIRVKKGVNACMMKNHVVTAIVDADAPEPPVPSTHAPPTTHPPRPTPSPDSYFIRHKQCSDYMCDTCDMEDLEIGKCTPFGIPDGDDAKFVKAEYALGQAILHIYADEDCREELRIKALRTDACLIRLSGSEQYTLLKQY